MRASLIAQLVKNPPAMWETWVRFLGREDPQEKGKATHSRIWPGELHGLYSPRGLKESDTTEHLSFSLPLGLPGKPSSPRSPLFISLGNPPSPASWAPPQGPHRDSLLMPTVARHCRWRSLPHVHSGHLSKAVSACELRGEGRWG